MEGLVDTFSNRLNTAMRIRNMKATELSEKTGIAKSSLSEYINGKYEAKQDGVYLLSKVLNVNEAWLMGLDVPMEKETNNSNIRIPLLGIVKAGYDYLADENIIDYIPVTDSSLDNENFFALKVKGDSMVPEIYEDDIAIVRKQDDFENGDYVVALVNGDEATIKKGYKTDTGLLLQPVNTSVPPLIFDKETIKTMPVKIIGVVYNITRSFK